MSTQPEAPVEEPQQGEFIAARPSRGLDVVTAVVLSVVFGVVLVGSRMLTSSVTTEGLTIKSWPTMTAGLGLVCSLVLLVLAFVGEPSGRGELEAANPAGYRRVVLTVLAVSAGVLIWWLGLNFIAVTPFLVAGVMWIGGARSLKPLIVLPLVTTLIIFVLFVLILKVPL